MALPGVRKGDGESSCLRFIAQDSHRRGGVDDHLGKLLLIEQFSVFDAAERFLEMTSATLAD